MARDNTGAWLRAALIGLSGSGSLAAVRLATPPTLDDFISALVMFFILPGLFILLLWAIKRVLAVALAFVFPFAWLVFSIDGSDTPLLWLVPSFTAILIALIISGALGARHRWKAACGALLLALVGLLLPVPGPPATGTRVLLVGIDGADWNRIDPLVASGRMPNFARLMEDGHRARLRSLPSLFSPQIWSTIATGCFPELHGIMTFAHGKKNLRVGTIWDQLKLEGRSFGVCNWFCLWPPEPGLQDKDFIVPDLLALDDRTFPPEYSFYWRLKDLERRREKQAERAGIFSYASPAISAWRHGIRLSTLRQGLMELVNRKAGRRGPLDLHWRSKKLYMAIQADVFAELVRTRGPEFAAVLFTQIDLVCHKYWKYMEPDKFPTVAAADCVRYGGVIDDMYAEMDRSMGKILRSVPGDADVLIVSDHGFQALGKTIGGKSCRILTTGLIEALGADGSMFGSNVGQEVYLWPTAAELEEQEEIIVRAENQLREAHLAGEDRPLFTVSRHKMSLHLGVVPRSTLQEDSPVVLDGREHPFKILIRATREAYISGGHHPDGIYLLSGPSTTRARRADSLHVVDVAPTLAGLLGFPVSRYWTGQPALEGPSLRQATLEDYPAPSTGKAEPLEVDEELLERLRAMGYLE